jgi:hypothetical protein
MPMIEIYPTHSDMIMGVPSSNKKQILKTDES